MKIYKQNQSNSLAVVLPKDICRAYGWESGDDLGFKIEKSGTITLFKK